MTKSNAPRIIVRYTLDLIDTLEKRSTDEVEAFFARWSEMGIIDPKAAEEYKHAPQLVRMASMCKMICNVEEVSEETFLWALKWLQEHGFSPDYKHKTSERNLA